MQIDESFKKCPIFTRNDTTVLREHHHWLGDGRFAQELISFADAHVCPSALARPFWTTKPRIII